MNVWQYIISSDRPYIRYFARLGIAQKLLAIMLAVIIVFSLLVGSLLGESVSSVMEEDLHDRGVSVATEVAKLSAGPIQTGNLLALDELLHTTKNSRPFIEYLFIVDSKNRIVVHTFTEGIPKGLLALEGDVSYRSDRGRIQDIKVPIEDGSLGYVRIGISERELQSLLTGNYWKLVGLTLLVGILGSLVVYRLTTISVRPLLLLIHRAEYIGRGKYGYKPVEVISDDEIGRLAQAMNSMSHSLQLAEEERKRLLQHLITVQENERKRISLELHDESGQALTAIMFSMRALANQVKDEKLQNYILQVRNETEVILQKLRHLAVELRPPALDELGLEVTLRNLAASYGQYSQLYISLECNVPENLDSTISIALYRIIQEGLSNIVKHAQATKALIALQADDRAIRLRICDDGIGLTRQVIQQARLRNRLGIYGIQERVEILGGSLKIESERPQWSTVYTIELPRLQHISKEEEKL